MKTKSFLPAFVLVLAACSSSPPPPAEEPSPEADAPGQASEPASNEIVEQGKLLIQDEKYGQARKVLMDARAKDPMDPQAAYYLGVALEGLKDAAGAEKQYREAIKLDPKLVEPNLNLSEMLLAAGDTKGALAILDEALKSNPKHPDLLLNRAVALEKLGGNKADVLQAYAAASAARPGDPMLHAVYGGLLSEAGKGKEAVVELKAALAAEDPALLMSIASVLTKENAFEECLQACDRAMLKKKAPAVLVRRGICKDGKKDTPGAIADFEAALAMDPNFVPAHFYYGLTLAATDKAKALEHVDKAIAGAPPDNPLLPEAKRRAEELRAAVAAEKKGGKTATKPKK